MKLESCNIFPYNYLSKLFSYFLSIFNSFSFYFSFFNYKSNCYLSIAFFLNVSVSYSVINDYIVFDEMFLFSYGLMVAFENFLFNTIVSYILCLIYMSKSETPPGNKFDGERLTFD